MQKDRISILLMMSFLTIGMMWLVVLPIAAQNDARVPEGPTLSCLPDRAPTGATLYIRGFVWTDDGDHNGIDDSSSGIDSRTDGVTVKLTCKNDSTGGSDTWTTGSGDTGVTGEYSFTVNIDAIPNSNWKFELEFTPPAASGLVPTWSNAGMNEALDSDIDGSGSVLFMATTTSTTLEYDAGFTTNVVTSILTGTVWKESLANDLYDFGERFVSNAEISFLCDEIMADGLSATTGFDGNYSFNLWYDPTLSTNCPLMIAPPAGLYLVEHDVGSNDKIDSDFNRLTHDVIVAIDSTHPVVDNDAGLTDSVPTSVVVMGRVSAETSSPFFIIFLTTFLLTVLTRQAVSRRQSVD